MSAPRRSAHMNVMVEAAEKAGRGLVRDFGEVENLQISKKGPGDFVSTADMKSEKTVLATLQKGRPTYGLLMEETGTHKGTEDAFRWIVDPLDGTTNFLHGIPHWCVTIALEKEGEIVAGVTYDPIKDELFTAEKGMGAFLNNRRLRVANRGGLMESVMTIGGERSQNFLPDLQATVAAGAAMRRFGSAALDLAYVAAGRFDAFWERGLNAWDAAAGTLLVREAGGYVTEYGGGKNPVFNRSLVAANPNIHTELVKTLKAAPPAKAAS